MSKLTFDLFRFQLIPISTKQVRLNLEEDKTLEYSYDELVAEKNNIFDKLVNEFTMSKTDFPVIKFAEDEGYYLFGIANKKTTLIVNDFKESQITTEPFVYVCINTSSDSQLIAISRNQNAFSNTNVVKNILRDVFKKHLKSYGLVVEIEALFEIDTFWSITDRYRDKIKEIDFEIVKPNMSRISRRINNTIKPLIKSTNSHKTNLKLSAPKDGVLENINKENEIVSGLVDYSSEGGGEVSLKIEGLRKRMKSSKMHKFIEVKEIDIKGAPDQLIKIWKEIVK